MGEPEVELSRTEQELAELESQVCTVPVYFVTGLCILMNTWKFLRISSIT